MGRIDTIKTGELTDTMYYILLNLVKPSHGYMIMQNVEKMTDGLVSIGPGSLYTTLKKLLDANLIEMASKQEENKKRYVISKEGLKILNDEIERKRVMIIHAEEAMKERNEEDEKK